VERFVEPAVLLLLREGASYGYELADALEALLDEGRVDFGNLYRLLRALEEEGLVRSSWNDDTPGPVKRVYEITDEGVALLQAWIESLRAAQERVGALLDRFELVETAHRSRE
jgi:DNA-binding PadR family transcriptional regulator